MYALQSRYSVEAIDTEKRDHATQICREAAREGYDVVVAFGGDGTVNEAANGLSDPFTYFRRRPIRVAESAGLETGSLGVAVLKKATVLELPTLIPRLLSGRAQSVVATARSRAWASCAPCGSTHSTTAPSRSRWMATTSASTARVEFGIRPTGLLAVV